MSHLVGGEAPALCAAGQGRDRPRRAKKRPGKTPRPQIPDPSRRPREERGEGDLHRSQDLPYCTFALPTHESFAGPASASHFSIATLYSASRLSVVRVLAGLGLLRRRVLARIDRDAVDLGVRLALDELGLRFLHADVLAIARQVVALFDGDVVIGLSVRHARAFASLRRVRVGGFRFGLGDVVLALGFARRRCPWRCRSATSRRPCRSCIARRHSSSPSCSCPSTSASRRSSANTSAPLRTRQHPARPRQIVQSSVWTCHFLAVQVRYRKPYRRQETPRLRSFHASRTRRHRRCDSEVPGREGGAVP